MIKNFFITLLFPWIATLGYLSYEEYKKSDIFFQRIKARDITFAIKMFYTTNDGQFFMDQALKKHWLRIIFWPTKTQIQPEVAKVFRDHYDIRTNTWK